MKIVFLDAQTATPNDLSWGRIAAMGDRTAYERTPPDQVIARCSDAEIVFTNKTYPGRRKMKHLK